MKFIIVNKEGNFWNAITKEFVEEYQEGTIYPTENRAMRHCTKLNQDAYIVKDYGYNNERTIFANFSI